MLEGKTQRSGLAHSKQKNLLYGIICYFILLFAYTGGSKLIDIDPLYTSLRNTPLYFGKSLALIISWGLPAVEIATALSLCFSKFRYTKNVNEILDYQKIETMDRKFLLPKHFVKSNYALNIIYREFFKKYFHIFFLLLQNLQANLHQKI